ncbi:hypothetical protein J0J30_24400, partial [Vibrio vulnificus]|nr:hypothetical protein [Vibrio vulnificus]
WLRVDRMVRAWLINTISKDLVKSSLRSKSAKHLWDDLKERFSESHEPMKYKLRKEINDFNQGHLSVTTYYSQLKSKWD